MNLHAAILRHLTGREIWEGFIDVVNVLILAFLAWISLTELRLARRAAEREDPLLVVEQIGAGSSSNGIEFILVRIKNIGRRDASMEPIGRLVRHDADGRTLGPVRVLLADDDSVRTWTPGHLASRLSTDPPFMPLVPSYGNRDLYLVMADVDSEQRGEYLMGDFHAVGGKRNSGVILLRPGGYGQRWVREIRSKLAGLT